MDSRLIKANYYRSEQLNLISNIKLKNGTLTKIYLTSTRYFYLFTNNINNDTNNTINNIPIKNNLLVYYHGSRDIALDCALNSTDLINNFGNESWHIVFGQCSGVIEQPYIHENYNHVAYGEIYWKINQIENLTDDIDYTKQLIEYMDTNYKINKKVFIGHSNGGVFGMLLPIYFSKKPNFFDIIVSHQGGLGFDPYFRLDFHLLHETEILNGELLPLWSDLKPKILLYTGEHDIHKSVCEQAYNIFNNENYYVKIIIVKDLKHSYKKECEITIKKWINDNL